MMLLSSAAAVVYSSEHAELSPELNSTDPSGSRETGNNKHTADYPHCIMFSIYNTSVIFHLTENLIILSERDTLRQECEH